MGRYNFAPQRVHAQATQLLATKRITTPPPWYNTIAATPPSERLVRPALQRPQKPQHKGGRKSSRLFKPLQLRYEEDRLRWEYFNDHPWELARPRMVLENDGRDAEKWDWSLSLCRPEEVERAEAQRLGYDPVEQWQRAMVEKGQSGRPLNGEAVVQRQRYLLHHTTLSTPAAYDKARKELYAARHAREIEQRVAREEAEYTGAQFGPGPVEIGMQLENQVYEEWREWAEKEIAALKQLQGSAYTGTENESAALELEGDRAEGFESEAGQAETAAGLDEVSGQIPASRRGQEAKGGAAVHP